MLVAHRRGDGERALAAQLAHLRPDVERHRERLGAQAAVEARARRRGGGPARPSAGRCAARWRPGRRAARGRRRGPTRRAAAAGRRSAATEPDGCSTSSAEFLAVWSAREALEPVAGPPATGAGSPCPPRPSSSSWTSRRRGRSGGRRRPGGGAAWSRSRPRCRRGPRPRRGRRSRRRRCGRRRRAGRPRGCRCPCGRRRTRGPRARSARARASGSGPCRRAPSRGRSARRPAAALRAAAGRGRSGRGATRGRSGGCSACSPARSTRIPSRFWPVSATIWVRPTAPSMPAGVTASSRPALSRKMRPSSVSASTAASSAARSIAGRQRAVRSALATAPPGEKRVERVARSRRGPALELLAPVRMPRERVRHGLAAGVLALAGRGGHDGHVSGRTVLAGQAQQRDRAGGGEHDRREQHGEAGADGRRAAHPSQPRTPASASDQARPDGPRR